MRQLITLLLAAAAAVLSAAAVQADVGDQLFKLLAKDGAAGDEFGVSVAISPDGIGTAIVGARLDNDNGPNSGSAYLFDTTTGRQLFKLLPEDGATGNLFGFYVAINSATAIVGAPFDSDNGADSGSAYLFDTTTGLQIAKLLAKDGEAGDEFGSVAISPDSIGIAIIGAFRDDDNGFASGSAYLFDISDPNNPVHIAKLLPEDGATDDFFGRAVAISPDGIGTAIVGAFQNDDNGTDSGSAYLFDTVTGRQIAKLLPDDGEAEDYFGYSVAISPDSIGIAIVGAYLDDDNGADSGSAYLFDTTTGQQIAKLLPDDGAANDRFGFSVAISPDGIGTVIVGALWDDDNGDKSGSSYLFDISDPQNPVQIAKLLADDGAADDFFGNSVAISPDGIGTAIVGAHQDDDNGSFSGSAYLFDASACPWDLDDNGVVGVSDLLSLLASWGPCKDCPADFDGNGDVGVSDLLVILANWGPCP